MLRNSTLWLIRNAASGSNTEEAIAALLAAFAEAGAEPARIVVLPDDVAPSVEDLRAAGVDVVAIFTGDGTINSVVTGLYGWDGAVLVLPGGTMNLLAKRLHGDAEASEIIAKAAAGAVWRTRPAIVRTAHGDALTGILAGPGAAWADVREAIREPDVTTVVTTLTDAIGESTAGARVACHDPVCGRDEGYSALTITARDDGLHLAGYYAATLADYARQGIALLRRNFRDGPHDELGSHTRLVLASTQGEPMSLLIDGETLQAAASESFDMVTCEVDLLATDKASPANG